MIYPFYTMIDTPNRQNPVGVGLKNKQKEMTTYVHQRSEGCITTPYVIKQYGFEEDGVIKLITEIIYNGEVVHSHVTKY